jgi:HAD superfamily hydrolase (TIGR01509 family)
MDGVIIDSHPVHRRAWKTFLQTLGREVTNSELDFILDGRKREEILCYFLGELTPSQIADYGARKDQMLRELAGDVRPLRGLVQFMDSLSQVDIRIGLATSAGRRRAHGTLRELGLTRYFDAIVTGDEVTAGKPDPAIYRLAAERLNETPENLLAVEDAVSGVKSARAAGMRCLGIASAEHAETLRAAGADHVIADFQSLSLVELEASFTRFARRVSFASSPCDDVIE